MVELNLFHYHQRDTFLNKAHPIAKLIALPPLLSPFTGSLLRVLIVLVLLVVVALVITSLKTLPEGA